MCATALIAATTAGPARAQVCARPASAGDASLSGVVNTYFAPAANATYGPSTTVIPLRSPRGASATLREGDLVLVIQMQCADVDMRDTDAYGDGIAGEPASGTVAVTDACASGRHAFVRAGPGSSNTQLVLTGSPLPGAFMQADATPTAGRRTFQVVRVPQYANATLAGTVSAAVWDGNSGGIVVLDVAFTLDFAGGRIDVDGAGFRGGGGRARATRPSETALRFRWDDDTRHAAKGEGMAGTPRLLSEKRDVTGTAFPVVRDQGGGWGGYPTGVARSGDYARGAPANAGGGGTYWSGGNDNGGGGGGANGGDGGRGGAGYRRDGYAGVLPDYSNLVERKWGFGGARHAEASITRLVMGGGGGAGDSNGNNIGEAASGAAGGGIVLVRADTLVGTGVVSARGARAPDNAGDGAGGGGGGGSVVIVATTSSAGVSVDVRGGRGGDAGVWTPYAHGTGGGGGGGVVVTTAPASVDARGGDTGVTTLRDNPPGGERHGAQPGGEGLVALIAPGDDTVGTHVGRTCKADLMVTKTNTPGLNDDVDLPSDVVVPQGETTYVITLVNRGPKPADGAMLRDPVPIGVVCTSAVCSATGGAQCPAVSGAALVSALQGAGAAVPALPAGGRIAITVACAAP